MATTKEPSKNININKNIKLSYHLSINANHHKHNHKSHKDLNYKGMPINGNINNDYKSQIRKNTHTIKFPNNDINKKRTVKVSNNNYYNYNKIGNEEKEQKKTTEKIMTKEQRNLLKTFLKENVKENKKSIAKNLLGMFLESNCNNRKQNLKNIKNNDENNVILARKEEKREKSRKANRTPKASHVYKKSREKTKEKTNFSGGVKDNIKKLSTTNIRPSIFGKNIKRKKQSNKENTNYNNDDYLEKINEINNNHKKKRFSSNLKFVEHKKSDNVLETKVNFNKVTFTSFYKLNQKNNKNENEENHIKKTNKFATPKNAFSQNNIVKKIEFNTKKDMIFQSKSFRDFVENNTKKNYEECLKFINSTHILSHLEESDKSLLIQSLKFKNVPKDKYIAKAHEKFINMFFVKEGTLECTDDDGIVIKTLISGDYYGEKELLTNTNNDYNIIAKTDCVLYSISVKSFRKMIGHKFRSFIFYHFMKSAFSHSKLFKTMNMFYIEKIFRFFSVVNLNKDNVAFPIGHKKSSKFVIVISGNLINSKTKEIVGKPLNILFEEELISLNDDKIKYALDPSPEALFFEGDTKEILKYLQCKSFEEVFNKNIIFENLSKIVLFKSFSQLKLYKLINFIHTEKYKDGEKIIKEGTIGEKFYIVKSGQVEVYQKSIYLRTLNQMEYFGERALLTHEARSATVIAKNEVELYYLDKESFNLNLSETMKNYLNISLFLHDETVSLDDLLFIKEIGKGNYGSVSLVMNKKTKFPYAIKAIDKYNIISESLAENIKLEKRILLKIDHPFIVKLVKCLKDEKNIFFLMEYIKGKELFEVIRDIGFLNKEQTNFYVASMMVAIQYLHERKIIYRDIKPENIIIEENGYLKLIDFGTAKEIEDRTKTIIGTPHYMAPEIITGEGYSFQVDYWSISICMYEFMCGEVPFGEKEEDPMEIYFAIINQTLTFSNKYITVNKEFKSIMKKMLDKNPSYRLSNFYSIKNHPWFKDFKWDDLTNLNLKPPYQPVLPFSEFDFNEQYKPLFSYDKQAFKNYVEYIKENCNNNNIHNNNCNDGNEHKKALPKEKLNSFKTWINDF